MKISPYLPALSLGALFFCGLFNFRRFGISWEAPGLRLNGGNAAIYIADKFGLNVIPDYYRQFPAMGENGMADHGVAYDLVLVVLERLLGITDSMFVYQLRTGLNFTVFILGSIAIYQLAKRRLSSTSAGLLAGTFFVLSPRIFAAGFFSPSDMVFASFFAIGVNASIKFLDSKRIRTSIFAGLICGYATDIRLLGIISMPIIVAGYLALNWRDIRNQLKPLFSYLSSFCISIYVFFPYLWDSPFSRFIEVFQSLSKYNWGGSNLYFGNLVPANDLPWHYIPVWIAITTPIFYLILFVIGMFFIFRLAIKEKSITFIRIQDYIFTSLVIVPILMVIFLNSVLYDSWRHLYFIYPFLIVICTIGWANFFPKVSKRNRLYSAKIIATFLCLLQIGSWMIMNNPRQYLYFNSLAGKSNLQEKWEMDFLGLSNKDVIQSILRDEEKEFITVGIGSFTPFDMSLRVVPSELRSRIQIVGLDEGPDLIINNFRGTTENLKRQLENYRLEKEFTVDDSVYFQVWRRR